ncbi:MAG TPA: AIR synthase-related protein, partial [Solirubrobacteraceae bacterium]
AHDIAEGGLAIALAECCLAGQVGADVELDPGISRHNETALLGEGPGGFVVSGSEAAIDGIGERVVVHRLGTVGGETLRIAGLLELSLAELATAHGSLAELFG